MTYSKDQILNMIDNRDDAVYRGLVAIYERQTADEQSTESTNHLNGVGFNGRDARFGSSLAKQIIGWNNTPPARRTYRYPLSRTQLEKGRNLLRKYAGQLARIANEKAQPADDVQAIIDTALALEAAAK